MMGEIRIQTTLTEQDVKRTAYYNVIFRNVLMLVLCWVPFAGGLLCLIFQDIVHVHYLLCIAFMLYPFIMMALLLRRVRQLIAKRKESIGQTFLMTFDDEQITLHSEAEQLELNWSQINEVRELPDLLLCYTSVRRMLYLPKRDMTEDQIIEFRSMIRNHLSYKKYRLK